MILPVSHREPSSGNSSNLRLKRFLSLVSNVQSLRRAIKPTSLLNILHFAKYSRFPSQIICINIERTISQRNLCRCIKRIEFLLRRRLYYASFLKSLKLQKFINFPSQIVCREILMFFVNHANLIEISSQIVCKKIN